MAKLFFSYSHKDEDEDLRDALEVHLAMLKRQGLIEALHDRRIAAGADLGDSIDAYLDEADVILCLLSPDFIASEYCFSREMTRALERHAEGKAQVIPVILRHCEWQETPLKGLRGTPRDNKPVRAWADQDEALNDVSTDIRRAIEARGKSAKGAVAAPEARAELPAPVIPRPRSSNLHIPKTVTDKDRDEYLEESFEFVTEFFANSIDELSDRNPEISGKLSKIDARRFVAAAYRDGKKVSAITVFAGGSIWRGSRNISFNNSDSGETNASNGGFDLPDRGDELRFRSTFGMSYGEREFLSKQDVAEAIWQSFISPLQR